jgi:small-conductance mechanosensitive channel
MDSLDVRLIGITAESGFKLLSTIAGFGILHLVRAGALRLFARSRLGGDIRRMFWARQLSSLGLLAVALVWFIAIWFDDPNRFATVLGLATAGLAIAMQKAVTSFVGYLVIIRGKTFTVGDRIKMGGVRGDVIELGFLQTRILEMGQPSSVAVQEDPGMWVRARQFTGRIVTVTNDNVFHEPVFNYTDELPFIWEEMLIPIAYRSDYRRAEQVLLAIASEETRRFSELAAQTALVLRVKYRVDIGDTSARVFWRMTDNWLELTVRFMVPEHGIRGVKDVIARRVLAEFAAAGISIASATYEIVGMPPLRVEPAAVSPEDQRG